jgi:uncharacterized protein YgiM (DUF1202 family)
MKNIRKMINVLLFTLLFTLVIPINVNAAEETVGANRVLKLQAETNIMDRADADGKILGTAQAYSTVISVEEASGGWIKVKYQDIEGYIQLDSINFEPESGLDAEFDEVSNDIMQMFETYQYAISRKNQRVIWGTVIVLIVIAMFAVGIVSAVVKGKKENGETNEHK